MPKRSTAKTETAQAEAAQAYAHARGLFLDRAPGGAFGPVDYVLKEHGRMGAAAVEVIEIKCRTCTSTKYFDVWVETHKVASLRQWGHLYDALPYFVVRWSDGVMRRVRAEEVAELGRGPVTVRRLDREDPLDTDSVYMLPITAMEEVAVEATPQG